jgi:hypothetical protein
MKPFTHLSSYMMAFFLISSAGVQVIGRRDLSTRAFSFLSSHSIKGHSYFTLLNLFFIPSCIDLHQFSIHSIYMSVNNVDVGHDRVSEANFQINISYISHLALGSDVLVG